MAGLPLAYNYVQLVLDQPSIRLVQILPGSGTDHIEVRFFETEILKSPDFVALSYAWGDPTPTARIYVNGQHVPIATNLYCAMKRLRNAQKPGLFWIDALSINQMDEVEKACQIPLMRQIYRQAQQVTVYLGEHEENSHQIPGLFQSIIRAARTIGQWNSIKLHNGLLPKEKQPIDWTHYQALGLPDSKDVVWDSLRKFMCRPWFRRVWVIQEAVLPTKATMVCGPWSIGLAEFFDVYIFTYIFDLPNFYTTKDSQPPRGQHDALALSMLFIQFLLELRPRTGKFMPWKCIDLLQRSKMALASVPHDYCYALLGLSEEIEDPGLVVDYTVSAEAVFIHFAKHFVKSGDGLQLLCSVRGQNRNLPSWVPDWSDRNLRYPTISPDPSPRERNAQYRPEAVVTSVIYLHPSMHNVLVVRGVICDCIDALGKTYNPSWNNERKRALLARVNPELMSDLRARVVKGESVYGSLQSIREAMEIADCVDELCGFLGTQQRLQYPTGENYEEIVEKTMRCGRGGEKPTLYSAFYQAFVTTVEAGSSWQCPHPRSPCQESSQQEAVLGTRFKLFTSTVKGFCIEYCRGKTSRGLVGQFVPQARVEDLVFMPLGSPVPFLIRPSRDVGLTYQLVGECYVHGMMKGEAFAEYGVVISDINLA